MGRFECHSHTHYSNLRILDSINTPRALVDRAYELRLAGIAITDHECLSSAVEIDKMMLEYREKDPNFKIARGNEIYLTDTRDTNQQYYHFILIAKNAIGHKMLRELSSTAWVNSYFDRRLERVPTLKSELRQVVEKYGKGNLISSSACLGGQISQDILKMVEARENGDRDTANVFYEDIISFIQYCKDLFGDDFYLEAQPAQSAQQLIVNQMLGKISKALNIKVIVTTDAHYLKKEDRLVHEAYLNSKEGEREVAEFYRYTYLQSTEEVIENLKGSGLDYEELEKNTLEIYDKIEFYSLKRNQQVPQVDSITDYPKARVQLDKEKYPTLDYLSNSDNKQERYWINQCVDKLKEKELYNPQYLGRLEYEADIKKTVGEKINSCIFAYPVFLQHYIDMFWECGSPLCAGRGCFLPDKSKVLMNDGTTKQIQDVEIGDMVRTIDGSSQKVLEVLQYDCNEPIYKVTVQGNSFQPLYNTDNHEYYAMKNKPCPYDRKFCSKNCSHKECKHGSDFRKQWVRSDELKIGDYVLYPYPIFPKKEIFTIDLGDYCDVQTNHYVVTDTHIISHYGKNQPIQRYIEVNKEFLYFLGVMIGDGWTKTKDGGSVGIAFHSENQKDVESMKRCIAFLTSLNIHYTVVKHKHKKLNQLYGYCKPFAQLMEELIGKGALNKRIPEKFLYDDREEMLSLLKGLLASDGNYDMDHSRISYDSINYNLVSQVKLLLAYFRVYSSIVMRAAYGNNKQSYKVRAGGVQLTELLDELPLPHRLFNKKQSRCNYMADEDGLWVKITNIETENYNGPVYDLTVEQNHNYIVNNCVVHNSAGSGLNHYLLGVTQTDPIKSNSPFWRYMNKDRIELPDIDIDISPSKRELIFQKIREERGKFGCIQVCTFSTESTKSAILTAARGYRSNLYPNGIDVDEAQYLASLIPAERGFLWPISDVIHGNEEKNRKPITKFIQEVNKFPGLLDIIVNIEGLIKNRSIHASGVNFYNDADPYETACFMKATNGSIITQYSLHDAEYCGDVKMDFLVTQQMDIMAQCIEILQDTGYIDKELTLRQAYDQYVHPDKIPLEDEKLWDAIDSTDILGLFQLTSDVGSAIVKKLKPRNIDELIACNSLMRLMGEEGQERPADRYTRLKNDIKLWYTEMETARLTKEEQKVLEKYMLKSYGTPSSQEDLMVILMDKDICGFTLAEANAARKLVAKKQMNKIPEFKEKVLDRAKSRKLGNYIWHSVIGPQLGYSFN